MRATQVIALLVVFAGLAVNAVAADEPLAVIGDKKISLEEFNQRYKEVREHTVNAPPKDVFLEDLSRYEIGLQEARKKKIESDPIVQERIRQEIYKGLIEKEIGKKVEAIQVSEGQMKEYYKKNPELRTSHILIEVKPDATERERVVAKKRAEEIYGEVKKSKRKFEELVALYTDDVSTKQTGGDVGFQTPLMIVPEYYNAAFKMKVGEIKGPVETKYGYHIIKLTERNPYEKANKQRIRSGVYDEERKRLFDDYFKGLRGKYPVKVNKNLLK